MTKASEKLIPPLGVIGVSLGLGILFGGGVGLGFLIASIILWRMDKADRKRAEFETRQALREAAWRAGDRRPSR